MVYYRRKVANKEAKLLMKYIIADPDEKSGNDLKKILDGYKILGIEEKSIRKKYLDIAFIRIDKIELNAVKLANLIRELNSVSKIIFNNICNNTLYQNCSKYA